MPRSPHRERAVARRSARALTLVLALALTRRAWAQGGTQVPTGEDAPELIEAARAQFREGARLASEGHWEEAREHFRRALAVRATPLTRFNLALAAQNSGHLVEAVDQYRQFLRDDSDPANAMRRQEAQQGIASLEPRLAHLVITAAGSDAVTSVELDGHAVPLALLGVEIPVDPGEHRVVLHGARGGVAEQTLTTQEAARQECPLTLNVPPPPTTPPAGSSAQPGSSAPPGSSAAPGGSSVRANGPQAGDVSALDRIRLSAENRAHIIDPQGLRRWERTVVLGLWTGSGHPTGLLGITARWAARPWFDIELQAGVGSQFGPGGSLDFVLRYPWSYRYSLGIQLGVTTNYTRVGGNYDCPDNICNFTPLWLSAGLVHEWRTAMGLTYRLVLGFKWMVNHSQLANAFAQRRTQVPGDHPDLVLDADPTIETFITNRVDWDWPSYPVMPFVAFDIGWSM